MAFPLSAGRWISDDRLAGDGLDVALVRRDALRIFGSLIRREAGEVGKPLGGVEGFGFSAMVS